MWAVVHVKRILLGYGVEIGYEVVYGKLDVVVYK